MGGKRRPESSPGEWAEESRQDRARVARVLPRTEHDRCSSPVTVRCRPEQMGSQGFMGGLGDRGGISKGVTDNWRWIKGTGGRGGHENTRGQVRMELWRGGWDWGAGGVSRAVRGCGLRVAGEWALGLGCNFEAQHLPGVQEALGSTSNI